ncbi:hypothetical protein L6452_42029 [Arctium lappa]|uniref:Uncharacterized protein n=1 Tax=Arctium lappa TaxID=4217 RepID=A0ACB8XGM7_ARCLA|nr:hypothetical protein L6452_42029 [Arctium lappa]
MSNRCGCFRLTLHILGHMNRAAKGFDPNGTTSSRRCCIPIHSCCREATDAVEISIHNCCQEWANAIRTLTHGVCHSFLQPWFEPCATGGWFWPWRSWDVGVDRRLWLCTSPFDPMKPNGLGYVGYEP